MCPSVNKPGHVRSELDAQHYKQTADGVVFSAGLSLSRASPACPLIPFLHACLEPYLLEFTTRGINNDIEKN